MFNKLKLKNVSKIFLDGEKEIFKNLSAEFCQGQSYAIMGISGAGKSTLLSLLAGLEDPTNGEVFFNDPVKELKRVHAFLGVKNEKPPILTPQNTNDYEPMKAKTRAVLNEYFAEENKKLARLLGDDFLWKS